ncbi:MAG: Ig-like domain-containing protein [Patescibacteria group bacterium]
MSSLQKAVGVFIRCTIVAAAIFFAPYAWAATLSVTPGTGVYTAGNTFTANIVVNTQGQPINAAEGALSFSPSELAVVNISRGSIFNLWTVEPTFSNAAGTINFGGGSPSGYTGSNGVVMSVTFRSLNAGTSRVRFTSGSVLAADGRGTNVLTSMNNGSYTFSAANVAPEPEVIEYIAPANTPARPQIQSQTHPDADGWYQDTTAVLEWDLPNDVTGVRTLLDTNSGSIPTRVYETPINSITLEDLAEGVQYFHIQFRNSEGWGRVAHYRLAVDTVAPTAFEISLPENADLSNPEQTLLLTSEDATSPVTRYRVQIDNGEPYEYIDETGSSTITLPSLEPGYHAIIIEAFDAAGNSIVATFSFDVLAFDRPTFVDYPQNLTDGVIPVITGQTRPLSVVTMQLAQLGREGTEYVVTADESGRFTFIPDSALGVGVYELSAVAIDQFGAQSEPSEVVRIAVQQPGYIQIGTLLVNALSVIITLVALLVLLGAMIWFVARRIKRLRKRVEIEAEEALAILEKEFTGLTKALGKEEEALRSSRKTKKLTIAEAHLIETMQSSLADSKRKVRKEISDVEALVDSNE